MRYTYLVVVPGTENIRFEGDRIEPYATQGGPISAAEKEDAALEANLPSEVAAVRDLSNLRISPEEKNPEAMAAKIEVHPLYDAQNAILDLLAHMDDDDLLVVPEAAIHIAPGVTPEMRTGYYARLASIAQTKAAAQAEKELARVKASLPATAQALIPAQVSLTVDGGA